MLLYIIKTPSKFSTGYRKLSNILSEYLEWYNPPAKLEIVDTS